ncbi:Ltp family lipoprotein [Microbacterium sp. NPDC091382]|uniref:Ltp family lipoprotein n=1 Tax=Microbacterium sp. NPDC091382 TaxID=3364210 RepID=UPI0037F50188
MSNVQPPPYSPPPVADQKANKPWFKKKRIIIPAAALALIVIGGAAGAANKPASNPETAPVAADSNPAQNADAAAEVDVPDTVGKTAKEAAALLENAGLEVDFSAESGVVLDRDNWTVLRTAPAAGEKAKDGDTVVVSVEKTAKPEAEPEEQAEAEPEETAKDDAPSLAHANALGSAVMYLDSMPFSRAGLIDQLTSEYGESYPKDVAEWAVDKAGADWNAEAAEAAQMYLDTMSLSKDRLYDQLTSEYGSQFTAEQAKFGLKAVGY